MSTNPLDFLLTQNTYLQPTSLQFLGGETTSHVPGRIRAISSSDILASSEVHGVHDSHNSIQAYVEFGVWLRSQAIGAYGYCSYTEWSLDGFKRGWAYLGQKEDL